LRTAATGVFARGDAAFADYSINAGLISDFKEENVIKNHETN
jgi:hypothetical protein